jgi:SAM-dependent methyltransferase
VMLVSLTVSGRVLETSAGWGGSGGSRSITDETVGRPVARRPAYAEQAPAYEERTRRNQHWRAHLTDQLPVSPGDVVLDVGCGTGLCFPLLQSKIGATGTIVGVDESPQMLELARARVARQGWDNVTLVPAAAQDARLPVLADAALFCAVHDVLQSPEALANVFAHLRPGAWVAAGGGKWAAPWLMPLNMLTFAIHRPYVSDFSGFGRPWRLLERYLLDVRVTEVAFGTGFVVVGRAGAPVPARR